MTSEVIEMPVAVERSNAKRSLGQAIHNSASGFVCGKKSFNAEFLQRNVQRRAQSSEGRKQAKRRVVPPVVDG